MEKLQDTQRYVNQKSSFYSKQKKTLEINPRHPLIKTLLEKVETDPEDEKAVGIAEVMFDTAVLRSGYVLQDQAEFSKRILGMLYKNLDIDADAPIEEEPVDEDEDEEAEDEEEIDADEEEEMEEEAAEEDPTEDDAEGHDE